MKMASYCIEYSILVLLFSLSGGKNRLFNSSGDKKAEWWLGPTTPDQCGQNPVEVPLYTLQCTCMCKKKKLTLIERYVQ